MNERCLQSAHGSLKKACNDCRAKKKEKLKKERNKTQYIYNGCGAKIIKPKPRVHHKKKSTKCRAKKTEKLKFI